jgi:hypothetical protein
MFRWLFIALLASCAGLGGPLCRADRPSPPQPRIQLRSAHVLLHTDLPEDEARALLARLETILKLISKYWQQPLAGGPLECYVVRDLNAWPGDDLSPAGRAKIATRSGITTTQTVHGAGKFLAGKSIVYASAEPGTAEHEIVHAYCGQTFGRTGPLWYSEGMAELGQYWQEGSGAVQVRPHMIEYLRTEAPTSVRQIIADDAADGEVRGSARTGDSWQAYAARWALCHLLVHNGNYAPRFRAIGLSYLSGAKPHPHDLLGANAEQLEFEYRQFVRHVDQGYRADLCRWDWNAKFRVPNQVPISAKVLAARGWQPSGAEVRAGQVYRYEASGRWRLGDGTAELDASGQADGAGRLEGVVLHNFELSEPFPMGTAGSFSPPADGRLYLRCREAWNELADNSGTITVKIRAADESQRPRPADSKAAN